MKKIALHWQILISLVLAVSLGLLFKMMKEQAPENSSIVWFVNEAAGVGKFVGDLFMSALKMIIVPLIVSSVIAGIASLAGMDRLKQLGLKTVSFYLGSTLIAATVGLLMVNTVQPGLDSEGKPNQKIYEAFVKADQVDADSDASKRTRFEESKLEEAGDWTSVFRKMFPPNIIQAATDNGQLLGLLVFSLMFGIAATHFAPEQTQPVRDFAVSFNEIMIKVTHWIMAVSPIGLFGMMLSTVTSVGGDFLIEMRFYMFTVLGALAVHFFIVLPLILKLLGKVNPLDHFKAMKTALMTAFATASSSATLPVTMRSVQENAGVSKKTASFTLPLGATVNMDGTALYECVAVIFVGQVMGVDLSVVQQMMIVFAALLTSIGVAGIPSASMVAILIIMKNANIPNADMAVFGLLAVDRILDMSRTAVNVFGDSCAAVVIAKSEGEDVLSGGGNKPEKEITA